jgi:hypothetical protein
MMPSATKHLLPGLLLLALTGCSAQTAGGRWRTWAWIVLLLVLATVTVVLISAIVEWQKRMARVRYWLELHNEGNVASRYAIQAEAPEGTLDFLFMLRGMALSGGSVSPPQASGAQERESTTSSARDAVRGSAKGGKGLLKLTSTVSGLLINLGNLLPYDVGVHFIRIGSKMRRGQGTAERLGRSSGQMSRYAGDLGGGRQAAAPSASPASPPAPQPTSSWVETPQVAPGESLTLELLISPENPYRAQQLSCVLRSRPLDVETEVDVEPTTQRYDVELTGLTPFQMYSPFLLLLIGVIAVLVVALILIGG